MVNKYRARQKPHIADDTALVCGKVGRRQSFKEHSERDALFLRKFRDLATPTLLHFDNAQASLALRSTSAASIMGEVRYCQRLRGMPAEFDEATQLNKLNEVATR